MTFHKAKRPQTSDLLSPAALIPKTYYLTPIPQILTPNTRVRDSDPLGRDPAKVMPVVEHFFCWGSGSEASMARPLSFGVVRGSRGNAQHYI